MARSESLQRRSTNYLVARGKGLVLLRAWFGCGFEKKVKHHAGLQKKRNQVEEKLTNQKNKS